MRARHSCVVLLFLGAPLACVFQALMMSMDLIGASPGATTFTTLSTLPRTPTPSPLGGAWKHHIRVGWRGFLCDVFLFGQGVRTGGLLMLRAMFGVDDLG